MEVSEKKCSHRQQPRKDFLISLHLGAIRGYLQNNAFGCKISLVDWIKKTTRREFTYE